MEKGLVMKGPPVGCGAGTSTRMSRTKTGFRGGSFAAKLL